MENRKSKSCPTVINGRETPAALKITCENQNHKAVSRQYGGTILSPDVGKDS